MYMEIAMKIQILGTGCPKCKKLAENAEVAAKVLQLDCQIDKVIDINQITAFGVMMTPALAVDGEVKMVGTTSSVDELKTVLEG